MSRIRPRAILIPLLIAIMLGLWMSWAAGSVMMRGHASPVAPAQPPARDLTIRTSDGLTLAATYRPGARVDAPAVLLLHGVDASRGMLAPNAIWLSRQGYATLTVDFRGHGGSSMAQRSFGLREGEDARAAFEWLKREQKGAPVAIIGISLGGAASLIGERGPVPADALILQAVYPDIRHAIHNRIATRLTDAPAYLLEPLLSYQSRLRFGVWPDRLSPRDALKRYPGPVMVIGGIEDRSTPPDETRAIYAAAPGRRALWLVPHGDHPAVCGLETAEYRRRVLAFLRATIG
ncbi:alpha/beta fold hydrolase [Sphingomonas sp. AOB5]|uniref:alpha/beta hydrolase n=1 Tax=Sphingomonas sp. AOB5 TaxID=3034017 RepID=UPI0023F76BF2|nr:alpha/beta fold hydrolase [Sphingomonas sp. AOB5]MDF7777304.1 alpha/beta fold hydrolase [Sphingomonas sp. AOB5]